METLDLEIESEGMDDECFRTVFVVGFGFV